MSAPKLIKEVKNGALYLQGSGDDAVKLVRLDNVRFSYPFLGTPGVDKKDDGSEEKKWRLQAMLPKATHVEVKDLLKSVFEELETKAGTKVPKTNWALKNGDAEDLEEKVRAITGGHWLVSASDGRVQPFCRDNRGQLIKEDKDIDKMFYGGCWGNVLVRPWYFSGKSAKSPKTYPKRLICGLSSVQFVKNDTPFGGGRIDDTDIWQPVGDINDDGMGAAKPDDDDDL